MIVSGFPGTSASKESTCNTGDPGLMPGLGRSPREGIGYPFQYSWASLVAQLVKNPSTMWETWVQSLGWEDPLKKKGTATHSSILAWRIQTTKRIQGHKESDTTEQLSHFTRMVLVMVHEDIWTPSSVTIFCMVCMRIPTENRARPANILLRHCPKPQCQSLGLMGLYGESFA